MIVRFRDAAEFDVGDALEWYRERGLDLADHFMQALDQCVESIQGNPLAYPEVHGNIRRALLRRFPYCVFYIVGPQEIVVLACLHGHADPRDEPRPHVHVHHADGEGKVWLEPKVNLGRNYGMSPRRLTSALDLVRRHEREILAA